MNGCPVKFNNNITQPIIPPEQFYTAERKLITIHTEDRDVCKWPNANHFEIELPESIHNVQSVRLSEISLPSHFYNISKQFQNNALVYSTNDGDCSNNLKHIELPDGFYTPEQLANILNELLGEGIHVFYQENMQKFIFFSSQDFCLYFDHQICYKKTCASSKILWCQPSKWGLGYLLGFDKLQYSSKEANDECMPVNVNVLISYHESDEDDDSEDDVGSEEGNPPNYKIIVSPKFPKLDGEHAIYMELDKFNSYDELIPHPSKSNNMYLNSYGGNVNAAFAKIQITETPNQTCCKPILCNRTHKLLETIYDPPIEKIQKLKFKFRYHNGMLVDFQDCPFTFSIEINSLRNDIKKNYKVGCNNVFC